MLTMCKIDFSTLRKLAHAINRDFLALKFEHFQLKKNEIFLFLLKTYIVGTC